MLKSERGVCGIYLFDVESPVRFAPFLSSLSSRKTSSGTSSFPPTEEWFCHSLSRLSDTPRLSVNAMLSDRRL